MFEPVGGGEYASGWLVLGTKFVRFAEAWAKLVSWVFTRGSQSMSPSPSRAEVIRFWTMLCLC